MGKPAEICTLLDERQTSVRRINGTDWPVVDQIYRVQTQKGRVFWRITRDLCNGVPIESSVLGPDSATVGYEMQSHGWEHGQAPHFAPVVDWLVQIKQEHLAWLRARGVE